MLDREELAKAEIDYEEGLKRFANKEALYEKYLKNFLVDEHFAHARAEQEKNNYDDVLSELHAMKGIAGTLGMMKLFDACNQVVIAIRAGETDKVAALVDEAEVKYQRVTEVLTPMFA